MNRRILAIARYAIALATTALMIGLTEVFDIGSNNRALFMPALLAVMISGLVAGFGPSVVSIVVSVVAIDYRFFEPVGSLGMIGATDLGYLAAFLVLATAAAAITFMARQARAAAEAALRHEGEEFRLLAETLTVMVWQLTPAGATTFINAAARAYFGLQADPGDRGRWLTMIHPDDVERLDVVWRRSGVAGQSFMVEIRLQNAGGAYRWHLVSAAPLLALSGDVQAWIGTSTDIDEQKQAIILRETFLSVASHELKTPITALLLQLHLLQRHMAGSDPALLRRIETATRHGDRLTQLVNNLLDVSRIISGRFDDPQPLSLREVVDEVVDRFGPDLERTGVAVVDTAPEAVVGVWDRLHLDQILTNLLTNALKYGGGSPITIRLGVEGTHACLDVRDGGPGIAVADQARIFEQYQRLIGTDGPPGHGLGLWIVRHLAERMGGAVALHSDVGTGTTFAVRLPLKPA